MTDARMSESWSFFITQGNDNQILIDLLKVKVRPVWEVMMKI